MAKNEDISKLDHFGALKRTIEESNDALRVKLIEGMEMSMELDAADGDSIKAVSDSNAYKVTLNTGSSDELISPKDCSYHREVCLYLKTLQNLNGEVSVYIEVSPEESGNDWFELASLNPGTSPDSTAMSNVFAIAAKRIRVVKVGSISSGSINVHLVVRS